MRARAPDPKMALARPPEATCEGRCLLFPDFWTICEAAIRHWADEGRKLGFTAEVMRLDADGALALRWLDLPLAIQQEMEAHIG